MLPGIVWYTREEGVKRGEVGLVRGRGEEREGDKRTNMGHSTWRERGEVKLLS